MNVSFILKLPPRYQIGELCKLARVYSGLTRAHVAKEIGISRAAVAGIESGSFCPSKEIRGRYRTLCHYAISADDMETAAYNFTRTLHTECNNYWVKNKRKIMDRGYTA